MSLVEVIGFIISLIAMFVLFFQRTLEKNRRAKDPKRYEEMDRLREASMKEFMRDLNVQHADDEDEIDEDVLDDEEEELASPPPMVSVQNTPLPAALQGYTSHRSVQDGFRFKTKIEDYQTQSAVEKRHLETKIEKRYNAPFLGADVVSKDVALKSDDDPYSLVAKDERSRAASLIEALHPKADMVMLSAIIGPPKSLQ